MLGSEANHFRRITNIVDRIEQVEQLACRSNPKHCRRRRARAVENAMCDTLRQTHNITRFRDMLVGAKLDFQLTR